MLTRALRDTAESFHLCMFCELSQAQLPDASHALRRYEDPGEAGDDDFMQAELDKLDQMGLTDNGRD